jgi:hypothetical protein
MLVNLIVGVSRWHCKLVQSCSTMAKKYAITSYLHVFSAVASLPSLTMASPLARYSTNHILWKEFALRLTAQQLRLRGWLRQIRSANRFGTWLDIHGHRQRASKSLDSRSGAYLFEIFVRLLKGEGGLANRWLPIESLPFTLALRTLQHEVWWMWRLTWDCGDAKWTFVALSLHLPFSTPHHPSGR